MLDSGARYSTINTQVPLSTDTTSVVGISGIPERLAFTEPLPIQVGSQVFFHQFLYSPQCPTNLMGRDILIKSGATMTFSNEGTVVTFPGGPAVNCSSGPPYARQMLMTQGAPDSIFGTTVYWLALNEDLDPPPVLSDFACWLPWIQLIHPYQPPEDSIHCTFNYLRDDDAVYDDMWDNAWTMPHPTLVCGDIFVGPEGVAAAAEISPTQTYLYALSPESAPHITLAVGTNYEAMSLGPMVKKALSVVDWKQTQCKLLHYSPSTQYYRISHKSTCQSTPQTVHLDRFYGRENTDHPNTREMLNSLPDTLWSNGPTDVGLVDMEPIQIELKPGTVPIWRAQYELSRQKLDGIQNTITGLIKSGVLVETKSRWNTPILPVPKPGKPDYRMVQDLRPINAVVKPIPLPVPNPFLALTNQRPEHKFFTVIDLANAFFCLPLHPDSMNMFAFTYKRKQYTYSRVPQGFVHSPGYFNQALKRDLAELNLPVGTVLIQYVDDILIASVKEKDILTATHSTLAKLAEKGYKVSKSKLQCARQRVVFLGRAISSSSSSVSNQHRSTILQHSKPEKVKNMLSFLGLTGFSKNYLPEYVNHTAPLRALITEAGAQNLNAPLKWNTDAEKAFISLKQQMAHSAELAIPDYTLQFHLDVSERDGVGNAVLFQKKGEGAAGQRQVLMYHSAKLDNTEKGHPPCTRHVAAISMAVTKTAHIVKCHPLVIHTQHGVAAYLQSVAFTLSGRRTERVRQILDQPNITFEGTTVNMAADLETGILHNCAEIATTDMRLASTLHANPLQNPQLVLFCDGCSYRDSRGKIKASYAVVRSAGEGFETLEAKEITTLNASAQMAEIKALTRALELARGQTANIYSDSAYATHAVHIDAPHWMRKGFTTSTGQPIKHIKEMTELVEAVKVPTEVGVMKCKGHAGGTTFIARGNEAADQAAKKAAGYLGPPSKNYYMYVQAEVDTSEVCATKMTEKDIIDLQTHAGVYEHCVWKDKGARCDDKGLWRYQDGRLVAPSRLLTMLALEAHGVGHVSKTKTISLLEKTWWHPHMADIISLTVLECDTCQHYNPRAAIKAAMGTFPVPDGPWKHVVIDFTDMGASNRCNGYRYLLVCVDSFSKWVEATPVKRETAKSVIKWLTREFVPRYGFPRTIRSDNGTHFSNRTMTKVCEYFGIKQHFGTVYHAQSQGLVERANRTLKSYLAKIMNSTKMTWLDALPLALMAMRSTPHKNLNLSPHEILTGRRMDTPLQPEIGVPRNDQDQEISEYYQALTNLSLVLSSQVLNLGDTVDSTTQEPLKPGEWVMIKTIKPQWTEPRSEGPYKVINSRSRAVRVEKKDKNQKGKLSHWIHITHCTRTQPPQRSLEQVRQEVAGNTG